VKAAKLAHHRRKSALAERIEAFREWRFAEPPGDGAPDSPTQDAVRRRGHTAGASDLPAGRARMWCSCTAPAFGVTRAGNACDDCLAIVDVASSQTAS